MWARCLVMQSKVDEYLNRHRATYGDRCIESGPAFMANNMHKHSSEFVRLSTAELARYVSDWQSRHGRKVQFKIEIEVSCNQEFVSEATEGILKQIQDKLREELDLRITVLNSRYPDAG